MTTTTFKQIAHLYIGCIIRIDLRESDGSPNAWTGRIFGDYELVGVSLEGYKLRSVDTNVSMWYESPSEMKPILRRLQDMTNDEAEELGCDFQEGNYNYDTITSDCTIGGHHHILEIQRIAKICNHLRSKFFDIDGLIESGQAIDASTLEVNPYKQ